MYKIYVDNEYILTVATYDQVCTFITGWFVSAAQAEDHGLFKFDEIKFRIVKVDVTE